MGVVDFNMLQSVLHVLAQQMRILDKNVELRGSAAQLPSVTNRAQTVAVTELLVQTDDAQVLEYLTKIFSQTPEIWSNLFH